MQEALDVGERMIQQKLRRVQNHFDARVLGVLCCVAYAASYLGRINYSAAMTEILESGVLNRSECGVLATVYFAVYGVGQLVNGFLADRRSPVSMVFIGTLGAGITNVLMSFDMIYPVRILLWGSNGFFQAMLWGPMLVVVSRCIAVGQRDGVIIGLNLSPSLGTIAAYLISGGLLCLFSWRSVFAGAGLILLAIAAVWAILCTNIFRRAQDSREEESVLEIPGNKTQVIHRTQRNSLQLLLVSGALLLTFASMVHGMIKDGITTWTPTYLMEEYQISAQAAVILTVVTPIVNVIGAYAGCQAYRITKSEAHSAALFFGIAGTALGLLILLPYRPILLSAVLLAVSTAAMHGVNSILISAAPLRFENYGKTATISGIMNAATYVGSSFSAYVVGDLSARVGWTMTQAAWLFACVLALFSCVFAIRRWVRFREQATVFPEKSKS